MMQDTCKEYPEMKQTYEDMKQHISAEGDRQTSKVNNHTTNVGKRTADDVKNFLTGNGELLLPGETSQDALKRARIDVRRRQNDVMTLVAMKKMMRPRKNALSALPGSSFA